MIVDPVQAFATATPLPTVVPTPIEFETADDTGKRTLWVVFVIMLIASIVFTGMAWSVPISKRLYHVITTFITVFATLSYFAMANGDGVSIHSVVSRDGDYTTIVQREVYWARYVDWSLTTPLLLLDLALLAGISGGHIVIAVVADIIMVLTGLFAAFGDETNSQKWGWYAMACIAYLVVVWILAVNGRGTASRKGGKVSSFYAAIGGFTVVIWTVYPIVWGFADGARRVSVDGEIIAYAVLDVLAKPIFGAWLLFTHSSTPETSVEVNGWWSHGLSADGAIRVGDDDDGA